MKLLLTLLLLPSLLHARPLIIQVQNQTDLSLQDFEDWANAVVQYSPKTRGMRSVRRIKIVERNDSAVRRVVNPQDFSEWGAVAKQNLDIFRYDLGQNILGPVLRRSNIRSIPGTLEDGTRFYGGIAYVTRYPGGYTNPNQWTSGVAYTGQRNHLGADRRLQSYITILHEAFHTLGVGHQPAFCNLMYPALSASYSSCRNGIIIDPLSNDVAAETVFRSVRDFRRKLVRCRETGRQKKDCVLELVRARNTLPLRRTHKCGAVH